ncbi:hypothetical protein [Actinobacillus capsulatus]|uniref:hypothetical protein n=1 Tax=Actinobacillus capsulatus TaxID=717 RepID=UPI00035D9491|nr:hypothetical protein [Actinobacillus capsulatus]
MNKKILILLFFSLQAFSKDMILFEDDNYRLYDKVDSSCNYLFLYDKESKINLTLKHPIDGDVNLAKKNCYSNKNKESIKVNFFSSSTKDLSDDKKFLRINYDLESNILVASDEYQRVNYSKCAILELKNAIFVSNENAREEICASSNFEAYVFPNISLPITWEGLLAYAKKNKFTDAIEYEVNNYISILLSIDYDNTKVNNAIKILNGAGYTRQAERISNFNYVKIKGKSYLYSGNLVKSNMYLIEGDIVKILSKKTDESGNKWYLINYKGKKDINMWIKAESVDLKE